MFPPVDEQMSRLRRGAVDLIDEDQLRKRLRKSIEAQKPLVVKVGFDPTSPDLHLGHTVLLRKMKHFQNCGHEVIFLVGDFTAMIGDPTGKKTTRPQLTREQVLENSKTYLRQVYTVLDEEKTVIKYNSTWLDELGAAGMVRLAGSYTLARMMERDDFRTRFQQNQTISIHELLYPLAQGYDSVALDADVELGGHDQIFNLLVGRDLMKERGQVPQIVLTVPLLVGTDGTDKMSKSLGNAIAVEDTPREMFGKTMSIPDALMWDWMLLLTEVPEAEIEAKKKALEAGESHPKALKKELARHIVASFHGEDQALEADREFEAVFTRGGVPEDVEHLELSGEPLAGLLASAGLAKSKSEARRLITQGAVSADGERLNDPFHELPAREDPYLLKVGKRRFKRLTLLAPDE